MRKFIWLLAIISVLLSFTDAHAQPATEEDSSDLPMPPDPIAEDESSPFKDDDVPDAPPEAALVPDPLPQGYSSESLAIPDEQGCNDPNCPRCNGSDIGSGNSCDSCGDCSCDIGDGDGCSCDGSQACPCARSWVDHPTDDACDSCETYGALWEDPKDCCDTPLHTWIEVDYLQWWVQGYAVPDLATSAPFGSTGALNDPNAVTVIGSQRLDGSSRPGARGRIGWWFDCCETCGIQAEFFRLETEGRNFTGDSSFPNSLLWRPYFNADPGINGPDAIPVDRVSVASSSQIYSINVLYRHNLACAHDAYGYAQYRFDLLAGYRHLRLDEELNIRNTFDFGTTQSFIHDRFRTDNHFHGGDIGVAGRFYRDDWTVDVLAKVGVGNNRRTVTVFGEEVLTGGGPPSVRSGGLLAQSTNMFQREDNEFTILPELGAEVSYAVTNGLNLSLGYTILWLDKAVRPGDQIDPNVDGRFLTAAPPFAPPATRPASRFTPSSMFVQGVNVGLEWRY